MKTKLSLLALPLCLGLALALALVACSSDNPGETPSTSSSSGKQPNLSSEVSNQEVIITDLEVIVTYEIGDIIGKIDGSPNDPIIKVEFSPAGWVETTSIILPTPGINLNGKAYIDLTNSAIGCGKRTIQVQACASKCSSKNADFEKPEYLCETSSPSGASSSSAEVVWRFGQPTTVNITKMNESVDIGSGGSLSLNSADDNPNDTQPDIVVSGGKIRSVSDSQSLIPERNNEIPNTTYSVGDLGQNEPNASTITVNVEEYFLIYFSNGKKYLVYFDKGADAWRNWPKKCTYWEAVESPYP